MRKAHRRGVCLGYNMLHNAIEIAKHIPFSNPQRPNTLGCKPSIAPLVTRGSEIMAVSIDLDAEFRLVTVEVENIWSCRMLVAKAKPCLLSA